MSNFYWNFGQVYKRTGSFKKAIKLFKKSIKICNMTNNDYGKSIAYNNLAQTLLSQGKYEKALDYSTKAYDLQYKIGDIHRLSITLGCIGNCYLSLGNEMLGVEKIRESIYIAKKINARQIVLYRYFELSLYYYLLNEVNKSFKVLNESKKELGSSDENSLIHFLYLSVSSSLENNIISELKNAIMLYETYLESGMNYDNSKKILQYVNKLITNEIEEYDCK